MVHPWVSQKGWRVSVCFGLLIGVLFVASGQSKSYLGSGRYSLLYFPLPGEIFFLLVLILVNMLYYFTRALVQQATLRPYMFAMSFLFNVNFA